MDEYAGITNSAGPGEMSGPVINEFGLVSFLSLVGLGIVSEPFFNALSLANDLLPLAGDIRTILGITDTSPCPDPAVAFTGLLIFGALMSFSLNNPTFRSAVLAAGDILPFPQDFSNAVFVAPEQGGSTGPGGGCPDEQT